jgi:hypothetical protein
MRIAYCVLRIAPLAVSADAYCVLPNIIMCRTSKRGGSLFANRLIELDVSEVPLFVGGLRAYHEINERSPLWGMEKAADLPLFGVASISIIMQVSADAMQCPTMRAQSRHCHRAPP